jgi:tryptophan synthase alpha chain
LEEYVSNYKSLFNQYGLYNIGLITPQTPDERVKYVDECSEGFVYMVSTSSTTGGSKQLSDSAPYFERIMGMNLSNPTLIGFNIHDRNSFETACKYSRGGIVGSAFIKALGGTSDTMQAVSEFVKSIR